MGLHSTCASFLHSCCASSFSCRRVRSATEGPRGGTDASTPRGGGGGGGKPAVGLPIALRGRRRCQGTGAQAKSDKHHTIHRM